MKWRSTFIVFSALSLMACDEQDDNSYTLYRNSPLDKSMRVHLSSFDATDGSEFNRGNCNMAAKILNANVRASAEVEEKDSPEDVGFWCEPGDFKIEGWVPAIFPASFPANTGSQLSW